MVMNLETGEKIFASKDFDSNVDGFVWSADAKAFILRGYGMASLRYIRLI